MKIKLNEEAMITITIVAFFSCMAISFIFQDECGCECVVRSNKVIEEVE